MSGHEEKFTIHVRAFTELLIELRAALGNDLDLVLVMAVIAERHYARIRYAQRLISEPGCYDKSSRPPAINTLSIALYTQIPRETIRRKVALLVEREWVERDSRGCLSAASRAADILAKGTAATIDYLDKVTGLDD